MQAWLGERAVKNWLGSVRFSNRVRARGPKFLLFIFFGMVRTIPSKKKVTRAIPAARADPKSKTILFFFCKVMVRALGLRPAQPGSAQLSPGQLISGSGELSAEG